MSATRTDVLSALERIAPLALAESWDNVGLLVDVAERPEFSRALVTIDLSEQVLDEALAAGADLVVAYHPPIFSGLKRLRVFSPSERVVVRAIASGLTIYSPHTALDAASGGMTDWLASALGDGVVAPVVPAAPRAGGAVGEGVGRESVLAVPLSLGEAVQRIKAHLGLDFVRLAAPPVPTSVRRVAVCPGAGGSIFEKVGQVDLLLTGEMRHHDVLARVQRGTAVVLTDHTNTERGYLQTLGRRIREEAPGLDVIVSMVDRDPLAVV